MKIVYLAAGAAGMYCGACLHDNTLAAALITAGHDALLAPTYTPIRTDETDVSIPHVLYGGINVFLQQKFALFRYTPSFVDRWLDSPRLLNFVSNRSVSVRPEDLGALAVSMLRGEQGNQRKELHKLVEWIAAEEPDIVHLSNCMLIGMARKIHERTGAPVVSTLAGEDIFLDKLLPPYQGEAYAAMRERANDVHAYVALNRYYADHMGHRLGVASERVHVVPHGLKLAGHGSAPPDATRPFTIGFLARICHDKGLHLLAEAFIQPCADPSLPPLRLRAAGYLAADDRAYLEDVRARLAAAGLADDFEYLGEVNRVDKIRMLQSIDVFSMPTVYQESKGLPVLESLANATPAVLPNHGSFPEIIADTGGGLLFPPGDVAALAAAIKRYMLDRPLLQAHGQQGQAAIRARYTDTAMAEHTARLYESLLSDKAAPVVSASQLASS